MQNCLASAAQAGSVVAQALLLQMLVCGKEVSNFLAVNKSQYLMKSIEKLSWPRASLQLWRKQSVLVKRAF